MTPHGRVYQHPVTGEQAPSVTTIISAGVPKPALVGWAAKMAAEHAVKNWDRLTSLKVYDRVNEIKSAHEVYTKSKGDIGDTVHNLVEAWQTGQAYSTEGVDSFTTQFINFMFDNKPTFLENEFTVWSRIYGYAGTGDFIARIGPKTYWVDIKTGKSLHDEVGLQLAALSKADFILRENGDEVEMPPCDGLIALHIRPRSWKMATINHPDECFKAFLAAKEILEWSRYIAPTVLGRL
jgi:hypothetical protein